MTRIFRFAFVVVLLTAALRGTAAAEITFPLNDNNAGVFDQPNATLNGNTVYVAFIGDTTGSWTFRVYFAAVNGAADFTNLLLPRDSTVILTPPVAIDNTGSGGNTPYFDARHPKIAMRTATEAVILFQARPTPSDVVYRPYIARVALSGNTATLVSVRQIGGFPAGVLTTGDIENIAIGATEVLGRTFSWGHPSVHVISTASIVVLAADESFPGRAGSMGIANLNPDAVTPKTGRPVEIGQVRLFLLFGPSILPSTFDLYHPEAFLDVLQQIHLTGYGISGSAATNYSITTTAVSPFASFVTAPISVGFNQFPAELPNDYTTAGFAVLTAKTIVFWSGLIPGSANRNLNFTAVPNNSYTPEVEEGCSMVKDPRAGETERIPGTFLLFLPAIMLAIRRISHEFRRTTGRSVAD